LEDGLSDEKPAVLLLGGSDEELASELKTRELTTKQYSSDWPGVEETAGIQVVVFQFTGDDSVLSKFLPNALQYLDLGTKVSIFSNSEDLNSRAGELIDSFAKSYADQEDQSEDLGESSRYDIKRSISNYGPQKRRQLANECLSHRIDRIASREVDIDPKTNLATESDVDRSCRVLLSRAFSDCKHILVSNLSGGRSDVIGVWKVEATNSRDERLEPFVVKCGKKFIIDKEISSNRDYVEHHIPFHCHPSVNYDRCVFGALHRLLVSSFVDHATRFDDFVTHSSPSLGIAALFEGPLKIWRAPVHQKMDKIKFAQAFQQDYRAIPRQEDHAVLAASYEIAVKATSAVMHPRKLLDTLYGIDAVDCRLALAHGDLQPRNIFVRQTSLDVVLIDFAARKHESPMSRDPATLDVMLSFDVWGDDKCESDIAPLDDESIRTLYTPPLLAPPRRHSLSKRHEAIVRLRIEAASDSTEKEYEISVACILLRFLKRPVRPKPERYKNQREHFRGLAYECASRLVEANKGSQ